jgi:Na+-transporting methylmalonyl-CoA/oxaloacetate decarboxylase gamma subunit
MVSQALQLMMYGLAGVFTSLAIFFVAVKIMVRVFSPDKEKE